MEAESGVSGVDFPFGFVWELTGFSLLKVRSPPTVPFHTFFASPTSTRFRHISSPLLSFCLLPLWTCLIHLGHRLLLDEIKIQKS